MTSLRIGFDMDGVLADFAGAYRAIETRLYGPAESTRVQNPEEAAGESGETPVPARRRRDAVWAAIRETPDFWAGLAPLEAGAVRRIHDLALGRRWEVFFITQRPATAGDTVQRQTQRWLVEQGFDLPSVLVVNGPRGAAAGALGLDHHVDDSPANCVDVKSESSAKPILIVEDDDLLTIASARRLGIGTAPGIGAALDILARAGQAQARPGVLQQLAQLIAEWRSTLPSGE